jgi:hypothetical protein
MLLTSVPDINKAIVSTLSPGFPQQGTIPHTMNNHGSAKEGLACITRYGVRHEPEAFPQIPQIERIAPVNRGRGDPEVMKKRMYGSIRVILVICAICGTLLQTQGITCPATASRS